MPYTLAVSGGNCRPVLNITKAGPSNVKLDWTTAAQLNRYYLESANQLNGVPWVNMPFSPPVWLTAGSPLTNAMDTIQFYRFIDASGMVKRAKSSKAHDRPMKRLQLHEVRNYL